MPAAVQKRNTRGAAGAAGAREGCMSNHATHYVTKQDNRVDDQFLYYSILGTLLLLWLSMPNFQ